MTDELLAKLRAFLKNGGKILASGTSGLSTDGTQVLLKELGIEAHGMSPFKATYMRLGEPVAEPDGALASYDADHVVYDRTVRVTAARGALTLARVIEPYFDRNWQHFSSHNQTPGDKVSRFACAVATKNTAYIAFPAFNSFGEHGNLPYRLLVKNIINGLIEPLLTVGGPSFIETTVQRQPAEKRTIVHLLGYQGERRTPGMDLIEDILELRDLPVSLKLPKAPKTVYLAPSREQLPFTYVNGRVNLTLPSLKGHAMIVFE